MRTPKTGAKRAHVRSFWGDNASPLKAAMPDTPRRPRGLIVGDFPTPVRAAALLLALQRSAQGQVCRAGRGLESRFCRRQLGCGGRETRFLCPNNISREDLEVQEEAVLQEEDNLKGEIPT